MSKYLKTGDQVKIITGKEKKQIGKIIAFDRKNNKVKIEGMKMLTSFNKETRKGITTHPGWIDASNVAYFTGNEISKLYRQDGKRYLKTTQKEINE